MERGRYILHLAGWYPSRVDAYNGDFVQRHAKSTAVAGQKTIVMFAVKDPAARKPHVQENIQMDGMLIEYICYYPARYMLDKIFSHLSYMRCFKKMYRRIEAAHGSPALVHVNIAWKAGLWALYLKRRYGLPYVITENWTGYYTADPDHIRKRPLWMQKLLRKIFRRAAVFLPVTQNLGRTCQQLFGNIPFTVVENAVDTRLFYYQPVQNAVPRLVHVSTMGYQKNIDGLLRVLARIAEEKILFELWLVGPCSEEVRKMIDSNRALTTITTITGNIPYPDVAAIVRQSDLMVLFSRYENLPCVILEALCCGLPVAATRVGGIDEVVDASNGMLTETEDEDGLYSNLKQMLHRLPAYDRAVIAREAERKFSYEQIGKKFIEAYHKVATGSQNFSSAKPENAS